MKNPSLFACAMCFFAGAGAIRAQTTVEGYAFEEFNRGFLQQVKITVLELPGKIVRAELQTDAQGHFSTSLAPGEYRLVAAKDIFYDWEEKITVGAEKVFLKLEMSRKPGYLFDVTVAEARENPELVVDAVEGATIEIFNRTQNRPELVLKQHPNAFFQHTFEQGNHYTMMIRKPGFLAKRIEVYVNVKGCIVCVDGVRSLTPGITENLTAKNTMGTLLTNIELERIKLDKRIQVQNIYYDFDKWDIRPDAAERLDHVVTLMTDNPGLSVELGSHTDSRGDDDYNRVLSDKRARSAVAYIVSEGVDSVRISAKGYGESQLVNRCRNDVNCTEEEHQQNRRTELRITGISGDSLEYMRWPSLEQIVREEERARATKAAKPAKDRRDVLQPEANNSVRPPDLITSPKSAESGLDIDIAPAKSAPAPAPPSRLSKSATPSPVQPPQGPASMRELEKKYSGFTIEIARADSMLSIGDSLFAGVSDVYWQKDKAGKFTFFTGKFATHAKAGLHLKQHIKGRLPKAKLVQFNKGKKTYI